MKLIILALGLLAVFAGVLVCLRQLRIEQPPPVVVKSQGPTIERLERLSSLVTSRVSVADILIGEGEGCCGAWLIRGDALLAVDLSHAQITEKDEGARRATIVLPPPGILQPRVDHERTKTWEVRRNVWLPWHADQDKLRDAVMLQAQCLVSQAAASKENIEQAKRSAAAILRALFEELGWDVRICWQETHAEPKQGSSSPAETPASKAS